MFQKQSRVKVNFMSRLLKFGGRIWKITGFGLYLKFEWRSKGGVAVRPLFGE